jgi:hypothetical protein
MHHDDEPQQIVEQGSDRTTMGESRVAFESRVECHLGDDLVPGVLPARCPAGADSRDRIRSR